MRQPKYHNLNRLLYILSLLKKFCGCVTILYIPINSVLVNRPKLALHASGGLGLICQGNPE